MRRTNRIFNLNSNGNLLRSLATVLLLVGCTATPPNSVETDHTEKIDVRLMTKTLSSGFRQISERYIEAIPASKLAIEGLRGLNTIDPSFNVETTGNSVAIKSNKFPPHHYHAPEEDNFWGWADLAVKVVDDIQTSDPVFRNLKVSAIYEAIFDGSLSLLDSFSRYSSVEKAKRNREKRSGFGGIGIRFKKLESGLSVTEVFPQTPASKAGVKPKDIITHADEKPLGNLKRRAAGNFLRGKIGSIVELKILRQNTQEPHLIISVKRDRIIAPTASHSIRKGIVYLKLSGFNNRTTRQVARHLIEGLREVHQQTGQKAKGVILDLRGNPGGLLKQAVSVSDLFLVDGRIISTRGRHPDSFHDYDARGADLTDGLPLVVLINGRSASASEIVAAALQDHDRAIVIGSTSYGKGTVQTVIGLPNKAEITLTWSRFQAPSGYYLHGLGVPPSICASTQKSASASEYIKDVLQNADQVSTTLRVWHEVSTSEKLERKRLKAICPTTSRRNPIDIQIAEKLLLDQTLYQRVKSLSPSLALIGQ